MSIGQPVVDVVFCASSDPTTLAELERDLSRLAEGAFRVRGVESAADLIAAGAAADESGQLVPLVFVDQYLSDASGVDTLLALGTDPNMRSARKVLIAEDPDHPDFERAVAAGVLDGTLAVPWSEAQLRSLVSRLVTQYFIA